MMRDRRPVRAVLLPLVASALLAPASALFAPVAGQEEEVTTGELYVRFQYRGLTAYGRVDGELVHELPGDDLFTAAVNAPTGRSYRLESVRILPPFDRSQVEKVIGVALNARRPGRTEPFAHPRWYAKLPSSLNGHEGDVELPPESGNLSYAGGLVLVIGREARHISPGEAPEYIWGVTVGNDFYDVGWYGERDGTAAPGRLPARATDGWAPIGPYVARGIDYSDLRVETRLNGQVVQVGRTSDLLNDVAALVSNISRYVTLRPGDVIFAGSVAYREGARRQLQAGDVVEVEIEGIGVLRNSIVPMQVNSGGRP